MTRLLQNKAYGAAGDFVGVVRDGRPFETDRLDNLETLRLMESVYRAAGVEVSP